MKFLDLFSCCCGKRSESYNELTKDGINYKRKRDLKRSLYPQSKKIKV